MKSPGSAGALKPKMSSALLEDHHPVRFYVSTELEASGGTQRIPPASGAGPDTHFHPSNNMQVSLVTEISSEKL